MEDQLVDSRCPCVVAVFLELRWILLPASRFCIGGKRFGADLFVALDIGDVGWELSWRSSTNPEFCASDVNGSRASDAGEGTSVGFGDGVTPSRWQSSVK